LRIILYWENKRLRAWEIERMWKCWEEEGCIYRVLIGGNKIWNLLIKKNFQRVRVTGSEGTGNGYGYDFELMWTGGKFLKFENHGCGYNGFFPKKTNQPFSNPYQFTRLYLGTGTDRGYTGTGCTRRVLANH
jgi:hypothetical protein